MERSNDTPIVNIDKLDECHVALDGFAGNRKDGSDEGHADDYFVRPIPARFRRIRCGLRAAEFFREGKRWARRLIRSTGWNNPGDDKTGRDFPRSGTFATA
jgi:hypothetical protein